MLHCIQVIDTVPTINTAAPGVPTRKEDFFWILFTTNMNQEALNVYQIAVHELFIRWDALKLAVEHMGGRSGQNVSKLLPQLTWT